MKEFGTFQAENGHSKATDGYKRHELDKHGDTISESDIWEISPFPRS